MTVRSLQLKQFFPPPTITTPPTPGAFIAVNKALQKFDVTRVEDESVGKHLMRL